MRNCKRFCSTAISFLSKECSGETILSNPPYQRVEELLDHYKKLEAKGSKHRRAVCVHCLALCQVVQQGARL